jgi:membrane protein YdbS with pleckstrin-like domain
VTVDQPGAPGDPYPSVRPPEEVVSQPQPPPPPPPGDWRLSPGGATVQPTSADPFARSSGGESSGGESSAGAAGQWQRPSPRLWSLRVVELLTVGVVALIAVFAALSASLSLAVGAVGAAAVIVVAGLVLLTLRRRVSAWGYAERDDDLLVRRGVLFRRLSVIPYGRMQFVDVTAGPFERLFGLATVRMHTAAAASDARIPGLGAEEAARLRDQLTALGEAQAAGL